LCYSPSMNLRRQVYQRIPKAPPVYPCTAAPIVRGATPACRYDKQSDLCRPAVTSLLKDRALQRVVASLSYVPAGGGATGTCCCVTLPPRAAAKQPLATGLLLRTCQSGPVSGNATSSPGKACFHLRRAPGKLAKKKNYICPAQRANEMGTNTLKTYTRRREKPR
jgi:hypothetical protein